MQPPIIFILCDQMRWDCLSCLGHPDVRTPHLDALAGDGVVFRNVVTQSPVCVPARACLFTGQYPHQLGCYNNSSQLWPEQPNMVRAIRDAGYATVQRGKLHLFWRHDNELLMSGPMLKQFGFTDPLESTGKCSEGRLRASAYSEHLRRNGLMERFWADLLARTIRPTGTEDAYASLLNEADHIDAWVMDRGIEAVDQLADSKEPFLLWLGPPGPHDPFDPPEPWASLYAPVGLQSKPIRAESPDPFVQKKSHAPRSTRQASEEDIRRMQAMYFGNISLIDHKVGQLVERLRARGIYDRSYVIFASDHGEMLGDFHLRGKACFKRASDQVPLIIKPPSDITSAPRGQVSEALVELIDLNATMIDIAGGSLADSQARSLLPLVHGESTMHEHRERVHSQVGGMAMVRDRRYKLVLGNVVADGTPSDWCVHALYDLEADPNETVSIADAQPNTTRRLLREWAEPFWQDISQPGTKTWVDQVPFKAWGRNPVVEHARDGEYSL